MRARFAAFLLISTLSCASLAGLAAGSQRPAPHLLEGVPDVVQSTNYSCGPSSLVAVLAYYGIAADESQVIRDARTNPEVGAELEDLASVAKQHGLAATACTDLQLADLEREVHAGYPVIALIQAWRDNARVAWNEDWDDGHYVVVIGIDASTVYVEDSVLEGARGIIPRLEFWQRWHDWTIDKRKAQGQALLVHGVLPPARLPLLKRFRHVP